MLTWYEICCYFLLYAFLGWVVEVAYHAVVQGIVVNRGFLAGPVCPIYGFGMVGMLLLLQAVTPAQAEGHDLLVLFFGGTVLATAIELFGGWALDKLFHTKWWDYSKEPFNFHGYICLRFSLAWGLGIVILVEHIHPLLAKYVVGLLPWKIGCPILAVLYAGLFADTAMTVVTLHKLTRGLAEIEQAQARLRSVSDKLTDVIADTSMAVAQKVQENQVQAALGRAELKDELEERRTQLQQESARRRAELERRMEELSERLLGNPIFGPRRLLQAFPDLTSHTHREAMELLKERYRRLRESVRSGREDD